MEKIKFDFEATKERIYAPNSNVPIGAPVDRNGNIANDGNAYGIVLCKETENEKYWVKYNLVVMVAGYCDIIDAQNIWGGEYSAEAIAAMSDIVFCDNHMIPGGSDPVLDNAKSTGGIGWTEQGEQTVITWDGNTDGKIVVGEFCRISEKTPTISDLVGGVCKSGDTKRTISESDFQDFGDLIFWRDGGFLVVYNPYSEEGFEFTETGIYFAGGGGSFTSLLTYGTPDTVHKIDEKYLPSGVMVVNFEYDDEFIAGKTVEEVKTAMSNGIPVFAVYHNITGDGKDLCGMMTTFTMGTSSIDAYSPILMATVYGEDFSQTGYYEMPVVWASGGEWMFED